MHKEIQPLTVVFALLSVLAAGSALADNQDNTRFAPDAEIRNAFKDAVSAVRKSVVQLEVDGEVRAMGTIIDAEGYALSKASELIEREKIVAVLSDGERVEAELVGVDRLNDLAMVKIKAEGLPAVELLDEEPMIGRWIACAGPDQAPKAVGIVSAKARAIKPPQLVLGVILREHPLGLSVLGLSPDYGAEEAGVQVGDIVTRVAGKKVIAVQQIIDHLQGFAVDDVVEVELLRDSKTMTLSVRLSELQPDPRSRAERMNRMGGEISLRRRGFERVLQHDAEIRPEHCGSPLVDLRGRVVGLNIARAGRISTFALPGKLLSEKAQQLKSGKLPAPPPLQKIGEPVNGGQPPAAPRG